MTTSIKTLEQGELAMQIISDHPLYASTGGITYPQAIAIAKALLGTSDFKGYLKEIERIDGLSAEELEKEINAEREQ